jgi:hypothetical protein
MRSRLIQAASYMLVSATLALACSSPSTPAAPKGRGTPACNEWQTAIVSWASKCGTSTASLQDQALGITCSSDQTALDCATAFNAAACTALPPGCQLRDLADPAPAAAACQQFIDETCTATVRCDPSTTSDLCHQQASTKVDCTKAIGVKLSFEQCISELKAISCQASMTPASCTGALVSSQ